MNATSESPPSVETALEQLQSVIRRPSPNGELPIRSFKVPTRFQLPRRTTIGLDREQSSAFTKVQALLSSDQHFEHLEKPEDAVREFVAQVEIERGEDHVMAFVAAHSRPLQRLVCYLAVEYLEVTEAFDIHGVQLLPMTDARIPELSRLSWKEPIGCVAAVRVTGTCYRRMADRSKCVGDYVLRSLRFALRHKGGIEPARLRFRLGVAFAFGDLMDGWMVQPDITRPLTLSPDNLASASESPVWSLMTGQSGTVARKADLALQWVERARFARTPLVSMLFLFFALEALLGDKSAGLKAGTIALRQMTLSHAVTGEFKDPDRTWLLYDVVRSNAIHGEPIEEIEPQVLQRFESSVFDTLDCYLSFTRENKISRRGTLMKALDNHNDREQLEKWLRENADPEWLKCLSQ